MSNSGVINVLKILTALFFYKNGPFLWHAIGGARDTWTIFKYIESKWNSSGSVQGPMSGNRPRYNVKAHGLFRLVWTSVKFDPETEFYSKYEREIKLGATTCMASASVPSQDGNSISFPGLLWADQISGGQGRVKIWTICSRVRRKSLTRNFCFGNELEHDFLWSPLVGASWKSLLSWPWKDCWLWKMYLYIFTRRCNRPCKCK